MAKYKMVCTLGLGDILVQFVLWVLLIIITFGFCIAVLRVLFHSDNFLNHTEIHQIA